MTRLSRFTLVPALAVAALGLLGLASIAHAQAPPQMGPPPGGTIGEEEPKQEGTAEKAPKESTQLPTLPPLPPYPGQERKKFELFTMNGYLRVRTSWFDNFHLGFHDTGQGVPFREPLTCRPNTPNTATNTAMTACGSTLGSANMRVRMEPNINLSETVVIHMQVDALDNLVLGSTASGVSFDGSGNAATTPGAFFTNSQSTPQAGKNSPWDSIRVKRAWGEVSTPLGQLTFGRMPSQWGMGMVENAGGYDWVHGTYCTDCDYGDSVDRIMFGGTIPGTNLRAAAGYEWASSGPTAAQLDVWKNRVDGQPYDLDDSDDVTQYVFMLAHIDDFRDWNLTVEEGRTAVNYGAYFTYRSQDFEAKPAAFASSTVETTYIPRHATAYMPDLWARFTSHKLILEGEAVAILGSIDNLSGTSATTTQLPQQSLRQLGAVFRLDYLMLDNDALDLQLEIGYASGDEWEAKNSGSVNVWDANYFPQDPNDTTITNFRMNFDFRPDLIFFREIMGAVTNATYFKPTIRYNFTDRIAFKASGLFDFANVPVATPGNAAFYGIELDGDLGYSNKEEGFFAGISYGVFFPFAAMDHPIALFPTDTVNSSSTAQTLLTRLVLKY